MYLKPENLLAYSHANLVEISLILSDLSLPLKTREGGKKNNSVKLPIAASDWEISKHDFLYSE